MAPPKHLTDPQRFTLALTTRQRELLGREAGRLQITLAELVRRIIDRWLDERG
jgi:hypothetical protein